MKTNAARPSHRSAIEPLESRIAPAFGGTLQLGTFNGTDGFKVEGDSAADSAGFSVSGAGDINGDGFDDLIVGAIKADALNGAAYVLFGQPGPFTTPIDLATLDGTTGFKLAGESGSLAGHVSAAGDVNGDGVNDLVVGAPFYSAPGTFGTYAGAAYVVFGHQGAFPATVNLGSLNGAGGFRIEGGLGNDRMGNAVSGVGDINADGLDDVIIGASHTRPNGADSGAAYVVFGRTAPFTTPLNVGTLNGSNGFKFVGVDEYSYTGQAVSGAGDFNGDGIADLIIGAPGIDSYTGESYVIFGKPGAFDASLDRTTLDGADGYIIRGAAVDDYAGSAVSGGGDINGDGFSDLIIGAPGDFGDAPGAAYVVFGKENGFGAPLDLSTLNGTSGFKLRDNGTNNGAGRAVANAGDVNGDGFDDVLVGALYSSPVPGPATASGTSYLVFGKAGAFPAVVDLFALNLPVGFKILGEAPGDQSGGALSAAGDINGDGLDDFVIGAKFADPNGADSGAAYLVFGQADAVPAISIGDVTRAEGQSDTTSFAFVLTLSHSSAESVSVLVSTDDGSATAGSDFTAVTNQLVVFAPGERSKTVLVNVAGDTAVERDEAFIVELSNPTRGTIADGTGLGAILNDDLATISIGNASVTEGQAGISAMTFAVTLSAASPQPVSVLVSSANGTATAPNDFTALNNQLVQFAPGETTKTVTVDVLGDTVLEGNETFTVILSSPSNATIADGTREGTIINDDGPTISISNAVALEGQSGGLSFETFMVTLSTPATARVSVSFSTVNGTATAGSDFLPVMSQLVHFAPGETTRFVTVDVLGDVATESNENFVGILSNPTNATIADGTGTAIIINDDFASPTPPGSIRFTDADGDRITVTLSNGTLQSGDLTFVPAPAGFVLQEVDITRSGAVGANLRIIAEPTVGGDGRIDLGRIDATGLNLGTVRVTGDLTSLLAGSGTRGVTALAKLKVESLGAAQASFPEWNAGLTVQGAVGFVNVADEIVDFAATVAGKGGKVAALAVGGDVLGSTFAVARGLASAAVAGDIRDSVVSTGKALGNLVVTGSIIDSEIRALGKLQPITSEQAVALNTLFLQGDIVRSRILAGYNAAGVPANGDAGLGTILIGGNFEASSIAAGARPSADTFFGTGDDTLIPAGNAIIAKIAAINIRGTVRGSATPADAFGIVAEEIAKLKVSGTLQPLTPGPRNDLVPAPLGGTGDVRAREVT